MHNFSEGSATSIFITLYTSVSGNLCEVFYSFKLIWIIFCTNDLSSNVHFATISNNTVWQSPTTLWTRLPPLGLNRTTLKMQKFTIGRRTNSQSLNLDRNQIRHCEFPSLIWGWFWTTLIMHKFTIGRRTKSQSVNLYRNHLRHCDFAALLWGQFKQFW